MITTTRDEMIEAGVIHPAPPDTLRRVTIPPGIPVLRLRPADRERARVHQAAGPIERVPGAFEAPRRTSGRAR